MDEWMNEYVNRCEVQFDYGLRQGRSLALVKRPDSFVSAEGKEMAVDKKVARVREKALKRGRVCIHFLMTLQGLLTHLWLALY
jgi:hypothetical protein